MRPQDKSVFLNAARDLTAFILVRRTNVKSLSYIGKPGYYPKPIDCKAKTAFANVKGYEIAGLVIDPHKHGERAFKPSKWGEATDAWESMCKSFPTLKQPGQKGGKYSVNQDTKHKHYGCVQMGLCNYVHGDYDLYDIIPADQPSENTAIDEVLLGQPHKRGPLVQKLQLYVNPKIGSPMVQHGGEAQFKDHSDQSIDLFGPNGEDTTLLTEHAVREWYRNQFQDRKVLKDGKPLPYESMEDKRLRENGPPKLVSDSKVLPFRGKFY